MSRNAIAAMAVIFVSGFAGCAATARAAETPAATPVQITQVQITQVQTTQDAPAFEIFHARTQHAPAAITMTSRAFRTP